MHHLICSINVKAELNFVGEGETWGPRKRYDRRLNLLCFFIYALSNKTYSGNSYIIIYLLFQ